MPWPAPDIHKRVDRIYPARVKGEPKVAVVPADRASAAPV
jgi:hypothetical protein